MKSIRADGYVASFYLVRCADGGGMIRTVIPSADGKWMEESGEWWQDARLAEAAYDALEANREDQEKRIAKARSNSGMLIEKG